MPELLLFPPTLSDMVACARREVAMRSVVFPRRVAEGRMKQATADRELETMRAILEKLEAEQKGEK